MPARPPDRGGRLRIAPPRVRQAGVRDEPSRPPPTTPHIVQPSLRARRAVPVAEDPGAQCSSIGEPRARLHRPGRTSRRERSRHPSGSLTGRSPRLRAARSRYATRARGIQPLAAVRSSHRYRHGPRAESSRSLRSWHCGHRTAFTARLREPDAGAVPKYPELPPPGCGRPSVHAPPLPRSAIAAVPGARPGARRGCSPPMPPVAMALTKEVLEVVRVGRVQERMLVRPSARVRQVGRMAQVPPPSAVHVAPNLALVPRGSLGRRPEHGRGEHAAHPRPPGFTPPASRTPASGAARPPASSPAA